MFRQSGKHELVKVSSISIRITKFSSTFVLQSSTLFVVAHPNYTSGFRKLILQLSHLDYYKIE